jgi:hypothetical protein
MLHSLQTTSAFPYQSTSSIELAELNRQLYVVPSPVLKFESYLPVGEISLYEELISTVATARPVELCVVFDDAAMRNRFSVFGSRLMSLTRFLASHCYRSFSSPGPMFRTQGSRIPSLFKCYCFEAAEYRPLTDRSTRGRCRCLSLPMLLI